MHKETDAHDFQVPIAKHATWERSEESEAAGQLSIRVAVFVIITVFRCISFCVHVTALEPTCARQLCFSAKVFFFFSHFFDVVNFNICTKPSIQNITVMVIYTLVSFIIQLNAFGVVCAVAVLATRCIGVKSNREISCNESRGKQQQRKTITMKSTSFFLFFFFRFGLW